MKILVLSDTHFRINNALSVIGRLNPTHIFHLGDMVVDAEDIKCLYPDIQMYNVRGNNDFLSRAPDDLLVEVEGFNYLLTHGHNYSVKSGVTRLAERAKFVGASFALFGHTHQAFNEVIFGVRLLNPSSRGYIIIENNKIGVEKY